MGEVKELRREDQVALVNLLHGLGIPSDILGYRYLNIAVELVMNNPEEYRTSVVKLLYPDIAERANTTPSRVERAIRHAISKSCQRGDYSLFTKLFKNSVEDNPTNSEFIYTIAEAIQLRLV